MKIKDILNLITDKHLYIELIEQDSGASFDILRANELKNLIEQDKTMYTEFGEKTAKNINIQYVNGKRLLVIKF